MGAELATPFDHKAWPVHRLAEIAHDDLFSSTAVYERDICLSINYCNLRPGDVILFSNNSKYMNATDRMITSYQQVVCGPENAKWQHVAILDSRLNVWDVMPDKHVRSRLLREVLVESAKIAVVRPRMSIDHDALDESLVRLSKGRYRKFAVETAGLLAYRLGGMVPLWPPHAAQRFKNAEDKVICSSFVDNVLRRTTRFSFFGNLIVVVPADFCDSQLFERVTLQWCRIAIRD